MFHVQLPGSSFSAGDALFTGNQFIQVVKRYGSRMYSLFCVKTGCVIGNQPQPDGSGIASTRPRLGDCEFLISEELV